MPLCVCVPACARTQMIEEPSEWVIINTAEWMVLSSCLYWNLPLTPMYTHIHAHTLLQLSDCFFMKMAYAFWLPTPYTRRFHMRTRHVLNVHFYLLVASAALMLSSCACNLVLCLVFREYISSFGLCRAASAVNVCLHLFVCVWEYCEVLDLYLSSENHHPLVFLLARTSKKYTTKEQEQDSVFIVPIWWTTRVSKLFRNTAANF